MKLTKTHFSFIFFIFILSCKTASPLPKEFLFHHEIRLPSEGNTNQTPTLILLHGYGSNEKDLLSFSQVLPNNMIIVCPRAPITIGQEKYSWYPLTIHPDRSMNYNVDQVIVAAENLSKYIKQLIEDLGIDPSKIFLGGFSQGGIMSMSLGLTQPELLAGVICLSGKVYPEIEEKINYSKALRTLDVFVSHGEKDAVLPISDTKKTVKNLEQNGMDISEHWYPVTHTISNQNIKDMVTWLAKRIGNQ